VKLFYYQDPEGNFGDDLNAWLWPRLIPDLLDDDDSTLFVAIGSILDRRIPQEPQKIVFGTGVGYGLLPVLGERWQIWCVRGPLTARALGLPARLAVTDPAALVRTVRTTNASRSHSVSFVPHFRSPRRAEAAGLDLEKLCASVGINYIDPRKGVEHVLAAIESSEMVLAEAMHGAIVADALRIPWVPLQLYDQILNLKWHDWCGSLGIKYTPLLHLPDPDSDLQDSIAQFLLNASAASPVLSDIAVLDRLTEQLLTKLEQLRTGLPGDSLRGTAALAPNPQVLKEVPWLYEMQTALEEVAAVVPSGATLILVDEDRWGGGQALRGRRTLPFLERDGRYWGLPPDSDSAIRELERLRSLGAQYLVFMRPSFWWLDFYAGFRDHLHRYTPVPTGDLIRVIALN
jgi:succinoglycan biosynthesis protein ExoV